MDSGILNDKIVTALVDSLTIEELEAILLKKKAKEQFTSTEINTPKPITEREKLKEHYR